MASATETITVFNNPTITVASGSVCEGQSFTIVPTGAFSYTIDDGANPFAGTSLVVTPTVTTSYTVVGTNTAGCLSANSVVGTVSVFSNPSITVSNYTICVFILVCLKFFYKKRDFI